MVRRKISRKTPEALKAAKILVFIAIVISLFVFIKIYNRLFSPVNLPSGEQSMIFYIPTGSSYGDVLDNLYESGLIKNKDNFNWLANKKNYTKNIKPGRYRLYPHMNNNELINLLRSGKQEAVRFIFNSVRNLDELAGIAGRQLEPDSMIFSEIFNFPEIAKKYFLRNWLLHKGIFTKSNNPHTMFFRFIF